MRMRIAFRPIRAIPIAIRSPATRFSEVIQKNFCSPIFVESSAIRSSSRAPSCSADRIAMASRDACVECKNAAFYRVFLHPHKIGDEISRREK
jgi:hypothetical protein